jgi:hypothetical protein
MPSEPPCHSVSISLPLSQRQAIAVIVAADAFEVEPWEIAVHALAWKMGNGH